MLVGRDPSPGPDEAAALLVPIPDPDRSVSKTHISAGVADGQVWIVDRGSTNGTTIIGSDGRTSEAPPGVRVSVPTGSEVHLGRRSFTVVEVRA
jgi:pSer/pThr/pTyr-binding forkhead associated (FHA) protein